MAFAGKRGGKVSVWSGPVDQMQGGCILGFAQICEVSTYFVAVEKLATAAVRERNYSLCFARTSRIMAMSVQEDPSR